MTKVSRRVNTVFARFRAHEIDYEEMLFSLWEIADEFGVFVHLTATGHRIDAVFGEARIPHVQLVQRKSQAHV